MRNVSDLPAAPQAPGLGAVALPLATTFWIQALVAFAMYSAPVMAPVAALAFDVSPAAVGYFIASAYFGSMLGSVTAGGWVARFGPIRVSQIGLMLCLVGLVLGATAVLPLVMLGGFVIGLGYGPTTPASSQILACAAPPSLIALTFSIKQTGVPAGGMLAGALVPTMILLGGWQGAALAIGVACAALAGLIEPVRARYDVNLDPQAPVNIGSALAPLGFVLRDPRLREMAVISFIYGGVQITLVTYLVIFLTESFALTLVLAGFVMAVSQVASVLGRLAWGVVADRLLRRRSMLGVLGLGMAASAFATLAAGPGWPTWLLFVFASVFGATAVGWNGVFLAEVARIAGVERASRATGGCLFFTFLGVVVTPPLFNLAHALSGNYAIAYAVFGVPALLAGLQLILRRP